MKCIIYAIVIVALVGLSGCTTPRPLALSEIPGENRLSSADIVDVALSPADVSRVDPWFHPFGDKSGMGVQTGTIWQRVFRGDDRSIAKLIITKAEVRESISGMGFTMRYTYIIDAHVMIGDRDYPIKAEGSRAAAMAMFSAVRQAVELGIADAARQAAALLTLERKKQPNKSPEPTTTSVTPAADAPVAPAAVVAHL